MLHNDMAQQQAGEQLASAPKTSQISQRAQTLAKFKTQTLKQADSQHEDIDVAGLRDWSKDTTRIRHIHGRHRPLTSGQLTTHVIRQMLQHPKGLTTSPQLETMSLPQPARNHSFGEGHVQARSVFGPEHGTEQHQLQPPALPPEAWPSESNTNKAKQPKRDKVFLNTTHC